MKIQEYPSITVLDDDMVAIVDGASGTKKIRLSDLMFAASSLIDNPEVSHRNLFRGKNLGATVTNAQWAAIADGSFEDLFVGDYWEMGGFKWRIADIDYWLNCGDNGDGLTNPHLVIVPDKILYNAQYNSTNTTDGGYVGSEMYKTGLNSAKNTIKTLFGSAHVLSHREYLVNAVTNGIPSAGAWYDSEVDLMTSQMVYGNTVHLPTSTGTSTPSSYTTSKQQLALFQLAPEFVNIRQTYWLRDVVRDHAYACLRDGGNCSYNRPELNADHGVRPAFAIG